MNGLIPSVICLAFFSISALAAPRSGGDLPIRSRYESSSETLTTERVLQVDPEQINPHLQRWALSRKVELTGLAPFRMPEGIHGIQISSLDAVTLSYVRGPGPWYRNPDEFVCRPESVIWFGTPAGARRAADVAAELWDKRLRAEKPALVRQLSKVAALSDASALSKAKRVFEEWVNRLEREWRAHDVPKAMSEEWAYYRGQEFGRRACAKSDKAHAPLPPPIMSRMEEASDAPSSSKPLVRAPARRWNGFYTVRLSLRVGERILNGQFLIDSGVERSVVSPTFLESQGILPALLEIPEAPPERVKLHVTDPRDGLGRQVRFDQVQTSGFDLDISRFVVFRTDFFEPPQHPATCCDGVLGNDFLSRYVVEFVPGKPAAIQLWPSEGFRPIGEKDPAAPAPVWTEVHIGAQGELSTGCFAQSSFESPAQKTVAQNLILDTGADDGLRVPSSVRGDDFTLYCPSPAGPDRSWLFAKSVPGSRSSGALPAGRSGVGMEILGRTSFYLDLPHGRIWFPAVTGKEPIRRNHTGLTLHYSFQNGERVLKVTKIRPGSPASQLEKSGLKVGMTVTQVDSFPAEDLDHWEVEQRLAGSFGETTTLQWIQSRKVTPVKGQRRPKIEDVLKSAPLKVR